MRTVATPSDLVISIFFIFVIQLTYFSYMILYNDYIFFVLYRTDTWELTFC